jgi:uncharacterized membrane protein
MPYCCQCGHTVKDGDVFCERCGARQTPIPPADPLGGISPRTAATICYIPVVGWIAAIVVLASARFRTDRDVRFHAFQGLYLFVAWLVVDWVVSPFFGFMPGRHVPLGEMLKVAIFVTSIFMLVKVSQSQTVRLPILGELAERSVSEQR